MIRPGLALLVLLAAPAVASGPGSVTFLVADGAGKPVAGAEVGVWNDDDLHRTVTDAEGRARLEGLAPGEWVAWAAAEGHTGEEKDEVVVVEGEETEVVFALEPGIPFSGRVVDGEGRPVADAYVEAIAGGSFEGYGEWKDRPPYDRVFAGDDGTFRVRGIPPGAVSTLVVSADGFREGRVAVRAQGDAVRPTPLVIVLDRGGTVSGRVTAPDGTPATGAVVHAVPADEPDLIANPRMKRWGSDGETVLALSVRTAEDGAFEVTGLALDAAIVVLAEAPGYARSAPSAPITPTAEKRALTVDLRLRRPATLLLHVTGPDGKPVEAGEVRLGEMMSGLPKKEAPDAPGEFRFAGLAPGEVLVTISAEGLLDTELRVVLAEGETTTREVVLSAGEKIAGVVRGPDGKPMAGVTVMLWREEDTEDGGWRAFSSGSTETDEAGRFEIRGLAPGKHELSAFVPGVYVLVDKLMVEAPKTDLDLTLAKFGTLRVRFRAPEGGVLPDHAFVWEHEENGSGSGTDHDLEDGVLALTGFTGKKIALEVLFEDYVPFRRDVDVALGEARDLGDVPLDPGVTVRGTVATAEGEPVPGALVSGDADRESVTDATGAFALPHLAAGKQTVTVTAEGFLDLEAEVTAGADAAPAALTLSRGAVVTGRLTDGEGNPLEDYWIQFRRPPTEGGNPKGEFLDETGTEADGRFTIRIPSGPCRILFIVDEEIHVLAELDLAEGTAREVELTLEGG